MSERVKIDRKSTKAEMRDFALRISASWNKQVESIIETGRLLIEAKSRLRHGHWLAMFKEEDTNHKALIQFSDRTAQSLMAIARNPILSDPQFIADLPRSWGTLYDLSQLPEDTLKRLIEAGKINCEMTRADVARLDAVSLKAFPKAFWHVVAVCERYPDPADLFAALQQDVVEWKGGPQAGVSLESLGYYLLDLHAAMLRWQDEAGQSFPGHIDPDRREEIERNLQEQEAERAEGHALVSEILSEGMEE